MRGHPVRPDRFRAYQRVYDTDRQGRGVVVDTESETSNVVIDLRDARATRPLAPPQAPGDSATLLHQVALLLTSTMELPEVLRGLAQLALSETSARRASVLLLHGDELRPAAAIGAHPDPDQWEAFRTMAAVKLRSAPRTWRRLLAGEVVTVEDASTSGALPADWVERFGLRAVALLPLRGLGKPSGLLALDYPTGRQFAGDELQLLEALAACAGLAVNTAGLYAAAHQRARLQEALVKAAATLSAQRSAPEIAEVVVDAYSELLGARLSAIGLFDAKRERITTLAARGGKPRRTAIPFSTVPPHILDELSAAWSQDPRRVVEFGPDPWFARIVGEDDLDVQHHLALPLVVAGVPRGTAILGIDHAADLDSEARRAALALADLAATALERIGLLERLDRHGRHMQALFEASTAVAEGANGVQIIEQLDTLLAPVGIRVSGLVLTDPVLREVLGLHDGPPPAPLDVRVPMTLGLEQVGELVIESNLLEPADWAFLEALGRGVAEVASRGALRRQVERAARERAIASERDRIAADLHDTVGQVFIAVGMIARRAQARLPRDSPWRAEFAQVGQLAEGGKWEIDQVVRAMAFVPSADRRLPQALRELAESMEAESGIQVLVEVAGDAGRMTTAIERALYRLAHEALTNAWRHARCAMIRMELATSEVEVRLSVRDDGVGLGPSTVARTPGVGLISMRRVIKDVGGSLRIANAVSRGTLVQAVVPMGGPR